MLNYKARWARENRDKITRRRRELYASDPDLKRQTSNAAYRQKIGRKGLNERARKHREENLEMIREREQKWRDGNSTRIRKFAREWRLRNRDHANEKARERNSIPENRAARRLAYTTYVNNNPERSRNMKRANENRQTAKLSDGYIKANLRHRHGFSTDEITPELIEAKRILIRCHRAIKRGKENEARQTNDD